MKNQNESLPIMETEDLASATECTGLTPAAVQTEEEGRQYAQMYAIHDQKAAWEHADGASRPKNAKRSK